MTPAETAQALLDKYWIYLRANLLYDDEVKEDAKHCALIAVDEIEKALTNYDMDSEFRFWKQVKQEIDKL
jgi:hypothetical protein